MNHRTLLLSVITLLFVGISNPSASTTPLTAVSISGDDFKINGTLTYPGTSVQGLLLNSRMINSMFGDANPVTALEWAYPSGPAEAYTPARNLSEFLAKVPTYASKGLNMMTVGMQGGCPWPEGTGPGHCPDADTRDEIVTAYNPSGSIKQPWLDRLSDVLNTADANGIVVTVSLFYAYQDQRITTDAGVQAAAEDTLEFLETGGWTNVMLEVCNECNLAEFDHGNLDPDTTGTGSLASLISLLNASTTIPVSASVTGGYAYGQHITGSMFSAMNYVTTHCNEQTISQINSEVAWIRTQTSNAKPVVFNECGTDIAKMDAAVDATTHASWGYYDQGDGSYTTNGSGFQSMPTKWGIGSPAKTAFFDAVKTYAGL